MKLSEAMREGAKLRPKAIGYLFDKGEDGQICSCAIGAAMECARGFSNELWGAGMDDAKEIFPQLKEFISGPVDGINRSIATTIINLNDSRDWSREEIADWLESIGY